MRKVLLLSLAAAFAYVATALREQDRLQLLVERMHEVLHLKCACHDDFGKSNMLSTDATATHT